MKALRIVLLTSILTHGHSAPAPYGLGVASLSYRGGSNDAELQTEVELEFGRFGFDIRYDSETRKICPGRWSIETPIATLECLAPGGIYRRLMSASGLSLLDSSSLGPPLIRAPSGSKIADPSLILGAGPDFTSWPWYVRIFSDRSKRIGASAGTSLRDLLFVESLVLHTRSGPIPQSGDWIFAKQVPFEGAFTHFATMFRLVLEPLTTLVEGVISTGNRCVSGAAVAVGLSFETARLSGRYEILLRSNRYLLPGGATPTRIAMFRGSCLARTAIGDVTVDHRLAISRLPPTPSAFRETEEELGIGYTGGIGRLSWEASWRAGRAVSLHWPSPVEHELYLKTERGYALDSRAAISGVGVFENVTAIMEAVYLRDP